MDDRSFERFGGWCAAGAALCSLLLVLVGIAARAGGEQGLQALRGIVERVSLMPMAGALMAALGLLTSVVAVAMMWRLRAAGRSWAIWGGAMGLLGGVMMAAHGLWDMTRGPALMGIWETGEPMRQAAISVLSYHPTPMDPRGVGSLLFLGLFVLVGSRLALADESAPLDGRRPYARVGLLGTALGVLLLVGFAAGLLGSDDARALFGALAFGLLAPAWWLMVAFMLLQAPPAREMSRISLS